MISLKGVFSITKKWNFSKDFTNSEWNSILHFVYLPKLYFYFKIHFNPSQVRCLILNSNSTSPCVCDLWQVTQSLCASVFLSVEKRQYLIRKQHTSIAFGFIYVKHSEKSLVHSNHSVNAMLLLILFLLLLVIIFIFSTKIIHTTLTLLNSLKKSGHVLFIFVFSCTSYSWFL